MYIDESARQLSIFEGTVPYMYLDTEGFVTAATGYMIPNVAAAMSLPFQNLAGGAATQQSIAEDFARVSKMAPGMVSSRYRASTSPVLLAAEMASLLRTYIVAEDAKLQEFFGSSFTTAPDPAKLALLDIGYECGTASLETKWPHLDAAVKAQDWKTCADGCHRPAAPAARNDWTRQQFLLAAQARA